MTTPVGGLRARMLQDSLRLTIEDILETLGWFDDVAGRTAITMLPKPSDWDEEVALNTLGMALGHLPEDDPLEVGSLLATQTWTFFLDFFAENASIGLALIEDVRAGLAGKVTAVGGTLPFFPVLDLTKATPVELFQAEITRLASDRPPPVSDRPWTKNLHVLTIEVEDVYGTDADG